MTDASPMLFEHCQRVYNAMAAEAVEEADGEITDAAREQGKTLDTRTVYEGHLTKIFNQLELATPYYTAVMNQLKRMGCVAQMRRGGGSQTSKWELIKEPDLNLFDTDDSARPTTQKQRLAFLEREFATLKKNQEVIMKHLGVQL